MTNDVEKRWSDKPTFRRAGLYAGAVVGVALLLMAITVAWAAANRDECADAQFLVCASPDRYVLVFGPTAILLLGGLGAFVRAYQVWRRGGTWPIWHGAGWALLTFMVIYLGISMRALAPS